MTEKVDVLADLINPYTGDNELNNKIAGALAPHVALAGEPDPLLVEIRDLLQSIDGKLSPPQPAPKPAGRNLHLGRVFAVGDLIPADVDLVTTDHGLRWIRQYGTDNWHPRDIGGALVSSNELLTRSGHVTEIPAPGSEAQ